MPTQLPCCVCKTRFRTQSRRIAAGKWAVLCVSCHTALVKMYDWHKANTNLDITSLTRAYVENVPKPAAGVAVSPKDKIA